ncbi:MAG: tRNA pseudouridine(38-40) synthase TruA [Syntrophomonadaceae bacterium]|jgi:tRNA pseudouridine38-40 synthase
MHRIKMIIQYDGSHYHGFQIQLRVPTVQAILQQAINSLSGEEVSLLFAGRTDAGVHALGQVIAFDTAASIPAERWGQALNSHLPADIQVLQSQAAPDCFHPRFQAKIKHYRYLIYRNPIGAVCQRKYAWCSTETLNIKAMQESCRFLTGRQNFKSFCASGSSVKTFTRTISQCHLQEQGDYLVLDIAADGFLYNMVRIIMGTLMEIGRDRRPAAEMAAIIARQDRNYAGPTAPPQGLYLVRVDY